MHPIPLTWTPPTPVPSVSAAGAFPWPSAALSGTMRSSSVRGTGAGGPALEGTAPLSPCRPVPDDTTGVGAAGATGAGGCWECVCSQGRRRASERREALLLLLLATMS